MPPSTRRSFRTVLVGLGIAVLGLTSCSSDAAASGVTQIDTAVVVAYKPCPGSDAAIEQLAFRDWVDSPRTCSSFGLFDAVLTGLVVASGAGLCLIALRILTRRVPRPDRS